MAHLYFKDVDTYIEVDPNEFKKVRLVSASSKDLLTTIAKVATTLNNNHLYKQAAVLNVIFKKVAAKYQGKTVTLNKPFRTPKGPKKFSVYVKNQKGNVVKVNFGDPNMKIKKNIPARRKSFRARHHCENPGPKWKARYWSCKAW